MVNWLSAILADAASLFYVFVYTMGLKRRTASNIVIGGAAGCFPVLVGWSAVTGTVSLPAIVLFAVIFFWTPPHFWALAMKFRDDYAAASVPMLPVVAPATVVARKILIYSYVMVASTLALAPYAGWIYTVCAVGLGGWFLAGAPAARPGQPRRPAGPRRRSCRSRRGSNCRWRRARGGRGNLRRDRASQRQPRLDAPVPPVHRLPDPAFRRYRGRLPAALRPLVGATAGPASGPGRTVARNRHDQCD